MFVAGIYYCIYDQILVSCHSNLGCIFLTVHSLIGTSDKNLLVENAIYDRGGILLGITYISHPPLVDDTPILFNARKCAAFDWALRLRACMRENFSVKQLLH
jgi:hypothetical protein